MKKTMLPFIAGTILMLGGCSKSAGTKSALQSAKRMSSSMNAMVLSEADGIYSDYESSPAMAEEAPAGNPVQERKLIRTGNISIEVESLSKTRGEIEAWVQKSGGYISNTDEWSSSLRITARIPSSRFEQAMSETAGFGRLKSKHVDSEDVTEQFYDLDSRLKTKKIMLERLESYLKDAKDIKDMITIESKINEVTADLESMQGQMNRLASQIDFSTITIDASLPVHQTEEGFVLPDTKSSFREFLSNTVYFFEGLLFVLLYVLIFGIPVVLILFLFWWLCFGKVGLLKKLFAKVNGSQKDAKSE